MNVPAPTTQTNPVRTNPAQSNTRAVSNPVVTKADPNTSSIRTSGVVQPQAVNRNQVVQNTNPHPPLKPGAQLTNSAFDPSLSKLPKGKTNSDGSLTSDQPAALPSQNFGSVSIPKGSKFNPDGSIEVSGNTRVRIDNFPLDVPKGSKFDKDGNLQLKDGMTVRKDGLLIDKNGDTIAPQDYAIKDGKILNLKGLTPEQRENLLNGGFQYRDKDGKPLPIPPRVQEDPSKSRSGRNYETPYTDPEANRQFNERQNNFAPERKTEADNWRKANPGEVFDDKMLDKDLASKLVQLIKQESTGSGRCYEAVANAIEKAGVKWALPGSHNASAFQFAEYLNSNPDSAKSMGLKRVAVPSNANAIPAGAVCVWDPGSGGVSATHGHIAIADGQGSQYYGVGAREFWSMPTYMFVPSSTTG